VRSNICIAFAIGALFISSTALAEDAGEVVPPPLLGAATNQNTDKHRLPPPPDLLGSPRPIDPAKLEIWNRCETLSKEVGSRYQYVEGKLLTQEFYRASDVGDCLPPCTGTQANDKSELAEYVMSFQTESYANLPIDIAGTYSNLKTIPTPSVGKRYAFCARYDPDSLEHDNKKEFLIDRVEAFKPIGD